MKTSGNSYCWFKPNLMVKLDHDWCADTTVALWDVVLQLPGAVVVFGLGPGRMGMSAFDWRHWCGQTFGAALVVLGAIGLAGEVAAQSGNRTLKVIYGFAAGNSGDALARLVADQLGTRLGVPAIVENRPGASGRVGTRAVIAAEPDGFTLLSSPMAPVVLHPVSYSNLGYEPFTALAPLSQLATFDIALAVAKETPVKTLAEFVTWVKANPDKATYGNPGLGGLPHFFAVMFANSAGVSLRNVPYRGGGAVLVDLVAGQLPTGVVPTSDVLELHNTGRVRILATSGAARSPYLPDVPTFKEAGYDIAGEGWYALYAPGKTPPEMIERLSREVQAVLRDGVVRGKIEAIGFVPAGSSAEELARLQVADRAAWLPGIKASGFKPTD
jgi:tripartite-type tricarboxylate transporter receptor subunit TctC